MTRLPIRARLVVAFALVMIVVLAGTGLFLYQRVAADLDRTVDRELDARVAGTVAIIRDDGDDLGHPTLDPLDRIDAGGVVQVLETATGEIAGATTPRLRSEPLVGAASLDRLVAGQDAHVDVSIAELGDTVRVKAAVAPDDGVDYTVLIGASLAERNSTLRSLSTLLLAGGGGALLLASLAGYGVAAGALAPVESMRRRAQLISGSAPGRRLPVPVARDEIASLGETLNEMLARLEAAHERERRFVGDASHELRTPLSILKAELDLALRSGRSRGELEVALRSAGQETDRLIELAEDLLVLARADDGRLALKLEAVDVSDLLATVRDRFAGRARGDGRAVELAPSTEVVVTGDRARVEQALANLVANALAYGDGTVELAAVENAERVELHVRDGGPGFPAPFIDDAFERFTRGAGGRGKGGSGLGLSIVDAIARAHGGAAHAHNRPEGGADVWLELPVGVGSDRDRPTAARGSSHGDPISPA